MKLPSPDAYRAAIQHPDVAFGGNLELAQTQPETNRYGVPTTYSGNFTSTFHMRGGIREWAVRCYTREIGLVSERYDAITRFLDGQPDEALTMARLVPKGIMVEGERHDIIQMEWINGTLLNEYVGALVKDGDTEKLSELAEATLDLGLRLERLGIAHGDIQHGNVLVSDSRNLRLVDYDDMFLQSLAHLGFASGIGQENYQHPKRGSKHYDEKLDRFSFISIYVALCAVAANPGVWDEYDGGEDCLLFRKADFLDPYGSQLFRQLDTIAPVKELVDRLASICASAYEDIPSLREYIEGRFDYNRFAPKIAKTRPAAALGTRTPGFVPDSRPVAVLPVAPPPPQTPVIVPAAASKQSGLLTVAGVACVIVVLTFIGILTHRSPELVTPTKSTVAAEPRSQRVLSAPTPVANVPLSTPRITASPQATPSPQATRTLPTTSNSSLTSAPSVRGPASPRPTDAPSTNIVALETKRTTHQATSQTTPLAKPPPQDTCSTADAPAHVLSLAQAQLSDEKRAASVGKNVIVTVDIAANGSVTDASVKQSADDVALDFAALSIARHSEYAAAEKSCAAAPGTVDVTVTY